MPGATAHAMATAASTGRGAQACMPQSQARRQLSRRHQTGPAYSWQKHEIHPCQEMQDQRHMHSIQAEFLPSALFSTLVNFGQKSDGVSRTEG